MKFSFAQIREYLFYLIIFLLPWQTRWIITDPQIRGGVWEYGRLSLYGWDILIFILLIISSPALVKWLKNNQTLYKTISWPTVFVWSYLCLLVFGLLSVLWADNKALTIYWFIRLLEAGLLPVLWSVNNLKTKPILLSLILAGVIQSMWGSAQFILQSTFANKWFGVAEHPMSLGGTSVVLTSAGRWLRAYAGQVHPNVLGGLLMICLLAIGWLLNKDNAKSKLLWFLYIALIPGLFFSFSRGAWLGFILALLWWWLIKKDKRVVLLKMGLVFVGIFVVLTALYPSPVIGRIIGTSRLEQQSFEERYESYGSSKNILNESWLSGVGLGNYTVALQRFEPGMMAYKYQPVHNIFLLVLTELGVVGLILFVLLLLSLVFSHGFFSDRLVLIIPILFISLFDHYWWTMPSMSVFFWLILAKIDGLDKTDI